MNDGQSAYLRYLAGRPTSLGGELWQHRNALLAPRVRVYASVFHDDPGAFGVAGSLAFPSWPELIEIWVVVAAGALWWLRRDRRLLATIGVPTLLLVPGYVLAWTGDALELHRHTLSSAVLLRLLLWIATVVTVDRAVKASREPSSSP